MKQVNALVSFNFRSITDCNLCTPVSRARNNYRKMEFSKYNVAVRLDNKNTAQVRLMTPGCQVITATTHKPTVRLYGNLNASLISCQYSYTSHLISNKSDFEITRFSERCLWPVKCSVKGAVSPGWGKAAPSF
jgi:hypothetical protein